LVCTWYVPMINMYLEHVLEYLIDEREREIEIIIIIIISYKFFLY
jgi:hypothetical protein